MFPCHLNGEAGCAVSNLSGTITFIGIGSNQDNPLLQCKKAIQHLSMMSGCTLLQQSSFYKTEPVGFAEQEWFINAVIEMKTSLSARELMTELQGIEIALGRVKGVKWGPRIIDLDILLYGQNVIQENDLMIPHPALHIRRFVLEPLVEIAPYVIHPAFGISVSGLTQRLQDPHVVEPLRACLV
jgi:2-amino-4-hydroxy-6-hydroxymethyldihydropteridine diphosphokinase